MSGFLHLEVEVVLSPPLPQAPAILLLIALNPESSQDSEQSRLCPEHIPGAPIDSRAVCLALARSWVTRHWVASVSQPCVCEPQFPLDTRTGPCYRTKTPEESARGRKYAFLPTVCGIAPPRGESMAEKSRSHRGNQEAEKSNSW